MSSLDASIVNVSLPTIAHYFRVDIGRVSAVALSYLLCLSGTLLIFGRLGDEAGRRRVFLWGQALFLAASGLCGLVFDFPLLVAARALQGVGGAMLVVSAYALIPDVVPPNLRGWGFGVVTTAAGLGVTLGAPLGGLLTGLLSWRWIFEINVPVGLMALAATRRFLSPHPKESEPVPWRALLGRFDLLGALLSFLFILTLLFALNRGREWGWGSPTILGIFGASALLFALFVRAERRHPNPLFVGALFRRRGFSFAILGTVPAYLFLGGNGFLLPFYLQEYRGYSAEVSGLFLMFNSICYMGASSLGGRASSRFPPRYLCAVGMGLAAADCLALAAGLDVPGPWTIQAVLLALALANGLFFSPSGNLVMGAAEPSRRGAASAVFSVFSRVSLALGVCAFETLFSEFVPPGGGAAVMRAGFRAVYGAGALICLAGGLFILGAREEPPEGAAEELLTAPEA
jgi:EmrB/QacA subfamily drug resistance transporter